MADDEVQNPGDQAWDDALSLFDRLSELPADECRAELARLKEKDPDAYAKVLKLMRADEVAGAHRFLAGGAVSDAIDECAVDIDESELRPAFERVGPWRLERSLGAGGMGRVWLARRHDGLYEGQVAIKMLREAVADEHAAARFAREGELLARLNHANIARLLDAGTLADGQRYLVLEYVRGERIDAFCDGRQLDIAARIRLFLQVCAAVAHAHANLVVHRDLKPANVLVPEDGNVKLLDFGVAKLIEDEAAAGDESPLTRVAGAGMTPEYAAPEQIEGGAITTVTDVYSLGMVLYRLLSGGRPYGGSGDSPARLVREIVDTEAKPLSAALAEETANEISDRRGTTPERLRRQLRGDLDNILAKALRKKPADRYASVRALMDDLEAYLDDRPVLARPDSLGYRLGKFGRRHKVGVAASAGLVAALIAGMAGILWQAQIAVEQKTEAERQAKLAKAESEKANAVKQFMIDLFRVNLPGSADIEQAQQLTARKLLDTGSGRIATQFATQPELRAELLDIVGELYFRLGEHERARQLTQERIAVLTQVAADTRETRLDSFSNLGTLAWNIGDTAAAREALTEMEKLQSGMPTDHAANEIALVGKARQELYTAPVKALDFARGALQERAQFDHVSPVGTYDMWALGVIARAQALLGQYSEALVAAESAVTLARRITGDGHFIVGDSLGWQGGVEIAAQKFVSAEAHLRSALAIARRTQGKTHPQALFVQAQLGALLHRSAHRGEGLSLLEEAVRLNARALNRNAVDDLRMRLLLGGAYWNEGRFAEAEQILMAAVSELRARPDLRLLLAEALILQSSLDGVRGRNDRATAAAAEALAIQSDAAGDKSPPVADALTVLAEAQRLAGEGGKAKDLLDKAMPRRGDVGRRFPASQLMQDLQQAELALWRGRISAGERGFRSLASRVEIDEERDYHRALLARAWLGAGRASTVSGKLAEAKAALEKAVDLRAQLGPADSPWLAEAKVALADCLIQLGERDAARDLLAQADAAYAKHLPLGRQFLYPLQKLAKLGTDPDLASPPR